VGTDSKVDIRLLGPPSIERDGVQIAVDTRKAIALLAYLTVETTGTRDRLAGLLWPESNDERSRATLRRTLSSLRTAVGHERVRADRIRVALADDTPSDIRAFASEIEATSHHEHDIGDVCAACIPHLEKATDLYRGDFLEGFSMRDAAEFEDWARTATESFRNQAGVAFQRLAMAKAATGDYSGALRAVHRWIDLDPLHEPAYRLLMLLHAWDGDRPGAVEAYRRCIAVLDQELGVPPLEETTELHGAILDEDLPPAPGVRRRVKTQASPTTQVGDLIDREEETGTLLNALDAINAGGKVVAVTGAAWMGKTRLLEELASVAGQSDCSALAARAFRTEQNLPFGVVAQLLRSATPLIEANRELLPTWAVGEIASLVPELNQASAMTEGTDPFGELRLFDGVFKVLGDLARIRPILMAVDDAQWLDPASASLISYIGSRVQSAPILLLLSVRSGEPLSELTAEVISSAEIRIDLAPLSASQLVELAGSPAAADALHQRTGGVPLLVTEELSGRGGSGVEVVGMMRYMESRLREVSDLARQVAAAASVLDGMCDSNLLRETSGRTEGEVVDAVEELVAAGLLREIPDGDGLSFNLDAVERMTYESTSQVRRRLLHRRAAASLADRPNSTSDPRLAVAVASQLERAGSPEAAEWYRLAADLSRRVYAHAEARSLYEKALGLEHADPAAIHLALGEIAMSVGDYDRALRELNAAAALATGDLLGLAEHRLGEVQRLLGRFEFAEEHYERALPLHPQVAEVHADWALLRHRTGDPSGALHHAEQAVTAAAATGNAEQLSRAHNILGVVSLDQATAMSHLEEAMRLAADDDLLRMAALNNRALLLSSAGQDDAAVDLIEEAVAIATRTGNRHREAALHNHLADLHHRAGREPEAEEELMRAVSLFADVDTGDPEPEVWLLRQW
jgi:DNA-binding SARP family transcriptional activator/tetratricopeptide (TPR) repeat protein